MIYIVTWEKGSPAVNELRYFMAAPVATFSLRSDSCHDEYKQVVLGTSQTGLESSKSSRKSVKDSKKATKRDRV